MRLIRSFGYAFSGIYKLLRSEANFRIHFIALIAVITLGLYFNITAMEWCIVLLTSGGVLGMEAINSSIEQLCNHTAPELHPTIKIVKDYAAAGVLIISILALIIGILVFFPYLF